MELHLENLVKDFSGTKAVDTGSFSIMDGKLTGLLGPSGCGKSTLLYLISGLQKPSQGKIFFGDKDVTDLPPEKRGIGLVFQNYALYPHMTVAQNWFSTFEPQRKEGCDQKKNRRNGKAGSGRGIAVKKTRTAFRRTAAEGGNRTSIDQGTGNFVAG